MSRRHLAPLRLAAMHVAHHGALALRAAERGDARAVAEQFLCALIVLEEQRPSLRKAYAGRPQGRVRPPSQRQRSKLRAELAGDIKSLQHNLDIAQIGLRGVDPEAALAALASLGRKVRRALREHGQGLPEAS